MYPRNVLVILSFFLSSSDVLLPTCCRLLMHRLHSSTHTTLGRIPLDEGDLYLTTDNILKGQTSISSARLEPTIPASERPQPHAFDRVATSSADYSSVWLISLIELL